MEAFIQGVSVWGTGLPGWPASQPVLAGTQEFAASEVSAPASTLLSATERRRTGQWLIGPLDDGSITLDPSHDPVEVWLGPRRITRLPPQRS